MTRGLVEQAIRTHPQEGPELHTPTQGEPFQFARVDDDKVVLLLGAGEA